MNYKIRKATATDLSAIYDLVVELAVYEKEPEAVKATLDDYQTNFNQKVFDAIVVEDQEKIIGAAVYYLTWSTWKGRMVYLEDFVVTQSYRQKGIGQLVFDAFLEEAKRLDASLVKWQVLDWNTPAVRFYEKNQAIIEKNWWNGKIFLKNF